MLFYEPKQYIKEDVLSQINTQVAPLTNKIFCTKIDSKNKHSILVDLYINDITNNKKILIIKSLKVDSLKESCFKLNYEYTSKEILLKAIDITNGDAYYSNPFSIRPASFSIDINNTSLISSKPYAMELKALNSDKTISKGYTQTIQANMKNAYVELILPKKCTIPKNIEKVDLSNNLIIKDGKISNLVEFKYDNVGYGSLSLIDNEWTLVDQNKTYQRCIPNSYSNIPDKNGKVGCLIKGAKKLNFLPYLLHLELIISNRAPIFTFLSNDLNMSATINIKTKAMTYSSKIATNYIDNCFAKDINYTIEFLEDISDIKLSWGSLDSRAIYKTDKNTVDIIEDKGKRVFLSSSINFKDYLKGESLIEILFNFIKDPSLADEPFIIDADDISIKAEDSNSIKSVVENRDNNKSAMFYYGRAHAPLYKITSSKEVINVYYEVYCKKCNKEDFSIGKYESLDSTDWYINPLHNSLKHGRVYELKSFLGNIKIVPLF